MYTTDNLRAKGLKATPARLEILELLMKHAKPLKAEEIWEKTKKKYDPATVYRILKVLAEEGFLKQIDFKQGHAYYEIKDEDKHHHHLICENCDKVVDIDCDTQQLEKEALKTTGFAKINNHSLEFFGVCKNCSK